MTTRDFLARALRQLRLRGRISLFRIYVRPLGSAARITSAQAELEVRLMNQDEVLARCADPEMDLRQPQVRGAFARGDRCLGAFAAGRLVGYNWLAYDATPHIDGVWAQFGPDLRYSYKTFVHPSFRGKRIAQALHAFADDPSLRCGKRWVVNYVDIDNFPSFAALDRAGSRVAGYAGYLDWFGKFLAFRTRGARDIGFVFYRPGAACARNIVRPEPA